MFVFLIYQIISIRRIRTNDENFKINIFKRKDEIIRKDINLFNKEKDNIINKLYLFKFSPNFSNEILNQIIDIFEFKTYETGETLYKFNSNMNKFKDSFLGEIINLEGYYIKHEIIQISQKNWDVILTLNFFKMNCPKSTIISNFSNLKEILQNYEINGMKGLWTKFETFYLK